MTSYFVRKISWLRRIMYRHLMLYIFFSLIDTCMYLTYLLAAQSKLQRNIRFDRSVRYGVPIGPLRGHECEVAKTKVRRCDGKKAKMRRQTTKMRKRRRDTTIALSPSKLRTLLHSASIGRFNRMWRRHSTRPRFADKSQMVRMRPSCLLWIFINILLCTCDIYFYRWSLCLIMIYTPHKM